ncbi:MAG: membrane protein insertase YidC [Planctomycetota bacterium]
MSTALRTLLSLFTLAFAAFAQGETGVTKEFGAPGETGSFRARFSKQTAGVIWLQATDHYVSLEKARKEQHEIGDYLLLFDNPDHALRVFQADGGVFAKDPADADWEVEDIADGLKFTLDDGQGLVLEKVLRHDPTQRGFVLELTLRNTGSDKVGAQAFSMLGPALVVPQVSGLFGEVAVSIAAPLEGDAQHVTPSKEGRLQQLDVSPSLLSFAGSTNRFFGAFLYPLDDAARSALTQLEVLTVAPRPGVEPPDNLTSRVRYGLKLAIPRAGEATTARYGLYLGPKSFRVFDTLEDPARFAPILDVDLNPPCCGITIPGGRFMAKFLVGLLGTFYEFLGNWGFAIILLTILVRGSMFPLNFRMQKSMRAYGSKMAKLKPQLEAMKKRYADDQKAYQQAMVTFQREHKIMPPIGGCLPIFLTMPIYLGLFTALRTAYDLRQEPWMFWIEDLSVSDQLVALDFWPGAFNLLPLLWMALFVFMSLRQPLPNDPQQRQMQMMMRFMPILFGVMLYNYASALLLYMVTSMLWSLIESTIVKKILGPMDPNAAAMAPTPI